MFPAFIMSNIRSFLLGIGIATIVLVTIVIPAIFSIECDLPTERPRDGGDGILWKVPVFTDDNDLYNPSVRVYTPTGITYEEYLDSVNDPNMIRHSFFDCGFYVYECPQSILDGIRKAVASIGYDMDSYNDYRKCITIQSFVTSGIRYEFDEDVYGCSDYAQTPVETLYLRTGDCEDVSILFVSIARGFGIDSELILYDGHCTAGVRIGDYSKNTVGGYISVECTAMWRMNCLTTCPDEGGKVAWSGIFDNAIGHWISYSNKIRDYNPIVLIWEHIL